MTKAMMIETYNTHYPKRKSKWIFGDRTTRGIKKYEFYDSTPATYENVISIDASERAFALEEQAFHRMTESDKQKYRGKFVAIYGQKVVDFDDNESTLIGRFFKKYGNVRVYIDRVGDENRDIEILSPYIID